MRYVNKIKQATLPDRSQGVFEPQAREVFDGEATPSDFNRSLTLSLTNIDLHATRYG